MLLPALVTIAGRLNNVRLNAHLSRTIHCEVCDSVRDTEVIIENQKVGAGMRIIGDRPLVRALLWSIRTVLAIEPYISIDIQPGAEFTWKNTFHYYTMPLHN